MNEENQESPTTPPSGGTAQAKPAKPLSNKQLSFLKSLAHHLDPVVQVGKLGITEALIQQIKDQIKAHELIKIRFGQEVSLDRTECQSAVQAGTGVAIVQHQGRVLTVYRPRDHKPKIRLPHV